MCKKKKRFSTIHARGCAGGVSLGDRESTRAGRAFEMRARARRPLILYVRAGRTGSRDDFFSLQFFSDCYIREGEIRDWVYYYYFFFLRVFEIIIYFTALILYAYTLLLQKRIPTPVFSPRHATRVPGCVIGSRARPFLRGTVFLTLKKNTQPLLPQVVVTSLTHFPSETRHFVEGIFFYSWFFFFYVH